jgi:hypothetical protein
VDYKVIFDVVCADFKTMRLNMQCKCFFITGNIVFMCHVQVLKKCNCSMVLGLSKMSWMEELRVGNGDGSFFDVLQFTCNVHVWCQGLKFTRRNIETILLIFKTLQGRMTTMDYCDFHSIQISTFS